MDLNEEFHLESSNCDPRIELRFRRDREREDLRKMIAQKRKEKNLRAKEKEVVDILVEDRLPVLDRNVSENTPPIGVRDFAESADISNQEDSFSKSSFFLYSQDDINVNRRTLKSTLEISFPIEPHRPLPHDSNDEGKNSVSDVVLDSVASHASNEDSLHSLVQDHIEESDSCNPHSTFISDDDSEDLEYDNLIHLMKQIIENSTQLEDGDDEFEENDDLELDDINEGEDDDSSEPLQSCPQDDLSELESHQLSPNEILSQADQLFSVVSRPTIKADDPEDELSDGSWDEFSDTDDPDSSTNHGLTVFGIPFPLGKTLCDENGLNPELSTPATRMEALREYLENSLGTDRFIKVYRLLKSVGPKDDDDELLSALERVVGVEGLRYMDTFFQLIHIEDKFESGEW